MQVIWSWLDWCSSRIRIADLRLYSRDWSHNPGLVASTWNPGTLNAGTRWLLWIWSLVCILCSRTAIALQWETISNKADITKLKTAPGKNISNQIRCQVSNSATVFDILCQCVNCRYFSLVLHHPNPSANFFDCIQSWYKSHLFFCLWIFYRGWLRSWETDTMMSFVATHLPVARALSLFSHTQWGYLFVRQFHVAQASFIL